jgi:TonB family protein
MLAGTPPTENPQPAPFPALLVELPSGPRVFLTNLRDIIFPRSQPPLDLQSAPAAFWPDVFVNRGFPRGAFVQSGAFHLIAFGILYGLSHLIALRRRVETRASFSRSDVIYYQPSEYLPPLDTRSASSSAPAKADPVLAPQPIISVPPEADNHDQTIVTPPNLKLKQHVALPIMVAWSDTQQKPRLAIPDAPLTPAAEITRMTPKLTESVVAAPPDSARMSDRRNQPALQNSVVAPPPDVRATNASSFQALQPALIAPPPSLEAASTRRVGDMNIAASAVIAPAPQLPLATQHAIIAGGLARGPGAPQVVPPPPSVSSGSSAASFGAQGHVIALNLHPVVGAPPTPPEGNRRGSFAAGPGGHAGASGSPGSPASTSSGVGAAANGNGNGTTNGADKGNLPPGLYVGKANAEPSPVAGPRGNSSPADTVNPNLMASVRPPRVSNARPMQPESATKLSEAERTVFGNRRFYSVTLNMPNLNSAGGSWVIRFAELKRETPSHDSAAPAADLTQPMATRKVDPAYPIQLMRENVAGTVILYAVIHADGSVGDVRVLRGVDDRLDRFASAAISQWKFDPATKNGTPVDVEATFQIPFKPARTGTNF